MTASRRGVVLAVLVGAGLLFLTGVLPWFRAQAPTVLNPIEISLSGASAVPVVPSAMLTLLAAALAVAIGKGVGSRIGAVVVVLAGALAAWASIRAVARAETIALGAAAEATGIRDLDGGVTVTPWPYAAAAVGALVALVGILALLSVPRWQHAAARFERTAQTERAATPAQRARAQWDAMERDESAIDDEDR